MAEISDLITELKSEHKEDQEQRKALHSLEMSFPNEMGNVMLASGIISEETPGLHTDLLTQIRAGVDGMQTTLLQRFGLFFKGFGSVERGRRKAAKESAHLEALMQSDIKDISDYFTRGSGLARALTEHQNKGIFGKMFGKSSLKQQEREDEAGAARREQIGLLRSIAENTGGINESFIEEEKKKKPFDFMKILKFTLVGAAMLGIIAFFQHFTWEDVKNTFKAITDALVSLWKNIIKPTFLWLKSKFVPFFEDLYTFITDPSWDNAACLIMENKAAIGLLLGALALKTFGIVSITKGIIKAGGLIKAAWGIKAVTAAMASPLVAGALGIGAILAGLYMAIKDGIMGYFKSDAWGVSKISGAIAGFFAGVDGGIKGMFINAGKWGLLGAGLGSVVPVIGTAIGGGVGALFGAILGFIGGEKIAKGLDAVGKFVADLWDKVWAGTKQVFTDLINWVYTPGEWSPGGTTSAKLFGVSLGFPSIGAMLQKGWDNLIEFFTDIGKWIYSPGSGGDETGAGSSAKLFGIELKIPDLGIKIPTKEELLDIMPQWIKNPVAFIEDFWCDIREQFDAGLAKAKSEISKISESIYQAISGLFVDVGKWIDRILNFDFTKMIMSVLPKPVVETLNKIGDFFFGDEKRVLDQDMPPSVKNPNISEEQRRKVDDTRDKMRFGHTPKVPMKPIQETGAAAVSQGLGEAGISARSQVGAVPNVIVDNSVRSNSSSSSQVLNPNVSLEPHHRLTQWNKQQIF